jgi:ABC-type bacteriocin/lantibiotic exporter with double-glycine peptidase domain
VLFYYSASLALVACAILLLNVVVTGTLLCYTLRFERQLQKVQGKLSGLVFQLLNGIAKLRVSGAEMRAFAVWAERFKTQKELAIRWPRVILSPSMRPSPPFWRRPRP